MKHTPIDRREFVKTSAGATALTLFALSSAGCVADDDVAFAPQLDLVHSGHTAADLVEPPVIKSAGGILSADITCGTRPVTVAGQRLIECVTYNDSFPGPTLVVRPGDFIDLRFTNRIVADQSGTHPGYGRPPRMSRMTNLHYHGLHVSPVGTADNMMVCVDANASYRYYFQIPQNHPAGIFWYHAHVHGLVTNQVSRGAAGMLIVANAYTDQLARQGFTRRLMMLQQVYLDIDERTAIADDGNRDDPKLALTVINGALLPDIQMRRGEPQIWSLVNASSSAFYKITLEGHTFDVIAEDGIPLNTPRMGVSSFILASGQRAEVVVCAGNSAGRFQLVTEMYNQGVDTWPRRQIASVVVSDTRWAGASYPPRDTSHYLEDLSTLDIPAERKRDIIFAVDESVMEGMFGRFTINGHAWDPNISEWTVKLNTVEEWHIINRTEQEHPFHVHTNPFQVTKINGVAVPFHGYADIASVPPFGDLTLRTKFTDFTGGPIMIHCHILDHEDMGMMTSFQIAP